MNGLFLHFSDWLCYLIVMATLKLMQFSQTMCRCRKAREDGRKNVFVYANDLLGDTIIKIPFFIALRNVFPKDDYYVTVVASPGMSKTLSRLGYFDEIVEEGMLHWTHPLFWLLSCRGMAKSLKWAYSHKADVFIDCHRTRSLGSDFAMLLCKPGVSCAYASEKKFSIFPYIYKKQSQLFDKLYSHVISPGEHRHQIYDMEQLLSLAVGQEIKFVNPGIDDYLPIIDNSTRISLPVQEYVVLVPGAGAEYRKWPVEKLAYTAKTLDTSCVVVGVKKESLLAEKFEEYLGDRVVNLCGKTTIEQLGGVLKGAKLVLSNETGTATYAAILGVPTVCILGGGDFGAFFPNPYFPNTVSVYHKEDCFNCGWKCPKKRDANAVAPCIERISVDEVLNAAKLAITAVERGMPHA